MAKFNISKWFPAKKNVQLDGGREKTMSNCFVAECSDESARDPATTSALDRPHLNALFPSI